jgi:hypothetical protein
MSLEFTVIYDMFLVQLTENHLFGQLDQKSSFRSVEPMK